MSSRTTVSCVDVNDIMSAFGDWTLRLDVKVFYSALYATIFVVGLIGNGLLIGSLVKRKRISVPNIFLINLAISDLHSISRIFNISITMKRSKWHLLKSIKFNRRWMQISYLNDFEYI
uniref:G-protein coupled receptors family 1 profile domain-containing protein n=1 Tax=Wuchereria bancrofti TaxID=6293 RepID=A0AAF5RXT5_WUCBA